MNKNLAVIGLGKLGYPMAEYLSSSGLTIKCYDADVNLLKKLKSGHNPLEFENQLLDYKNNGNNLNFYLNFEDCIKDTFMCFITVPTNSLKDGNFDNSILINVLDKLCIHIKKTNSKYYIVINSTVSPGSINEVLIPHVEKKGLKNKLDFAFIYNPYFVALGDVIKGLSEPDFILIGYDDIEAIKIIKDFYNKIYNKPKFVELNFKESELAKLLVNTFLTLKISFTNLTREITKKDKNISALKILECIGSDQRIGQRYLRPGGPFSGPCLPRDNQALQAFCNRIGSKNFLSDSILHTNSNVIKNFTNDMTAIKEKGYKVIGFAGFGYKSNANSLEDSFLLDLIKKCDEIDFDIIIYDSYLVPEIPFKLKKKIRFVESLKKLEDSCDIIFLPYIDKKFNYFLNGKKVIFDIWCQLTGENIFSKSIKIPKFEITEKDQKIINFNN